MNGINEQMREKGVREQLDLFWFGEPKFVITIIQFMQFGYALGLAIVLMYWKYLTTVEPYYYLLAVVSCYVIFVFVLSKALPQYICASSLGYLVDKDNLTETVAVHRLEDARRLGLRKSDEPQKIDGTTISIDADSLSTDFKSSLKTGEFDDSIATSLDDDYSATADKTQILAELVQSDTASLRDLLPEDARNSLRRRELRRGNRRSTSDGVALMRAFGNVMGDSKQGSRPEVVPPEPKVVDDSEIMRRNRAERAANRKKRNKTVSASAMIQSWHMVTKTRRGGKRTSDS